MHPSTLTNITLADRAHELLVIVSFGVDFRELWQHPVLEVG